LHELNVPIIFLERPDCDKDINYTVLNKATTTHIRTYNKSTCNLLQDKLCNYFYTKPMKLSCALVSSNDLELYLDFWPIVKKAWNNVVDIPVKLVLVADKIPDIYANDPDIILFKPPKGMHTGFISQCIRLFYPALLDYNGGIIISDMDMIPTNNTYYHNNIKSFDTSKFINYRDCLQGEYPMCYNVATNKVWSEIFNINTLDDVYTRLEQLYKTTNYSGIHGGAGWSTDQVYLYNTVNSWNNQTKNLVLLNDSKTGFKRLDRADRDIKNLDSQRKQLVKNYFYADYHMLRPYKQYKQINDEIINLLTARKKKVVAFSLWGNNKLYSEGAILNAYTVPKVLGPSWKSRFYIDAAFNDKDVINKLQNAGAEIIYKNQISDQPIYGMTWRFLAACDPTVDIMLSRDCDSQISQREADAINEWLTSDSSFHVIRDNPAHGIEIMGGTWGCKGGINDMQELIDKWTKTHKFINKGDDQIFLRACIWPRIQNVCMAHDAYFGEIIKQKYTRLMHPPKILYGYVGSIYKIIK
jgi:hypothetical protein